MSKPKKPLNLLIDIRAWQEQTATLTPAEYGALLKLKMHYWRIGQIPDRDIALAQITGFGPREWKEARQGLEPLFIVADGEWFRADWSDELEAAFAAVKKYSEASKIANKVRWARHKQRGKVSGSDSDRDSGKDSDKDSGSAPPSLLKYTDNAPSQEKDDFTSPSIDLDHVISSLETKWRGGVHGL